MPWTRCQACNVIKGRAARSFDGSVLGRPVRIGQRPGLFEPAGVKDRCTVADADLMSAERLPSRAGPVADRLTIWPLDDGRYGLDATFQGASGYERAARHEVELERGGVPYRFHQELDGGWTIRFGPLRAVDVAVALSAFVH